VLARDRQALDPQDVAELQKNMLVVDQAIGESKAALKTQPMNTQAQDSLFEAFRTKIVLLQDTISLINEVRKGNQAEAARIAGAMNKP
jgi:molybdenum cofactor biosynthesis enzyme